MTDEERKAADGPELKPGQTFLLLAGDILLGHTQLGWESCGEGQWLREGVFEPAAAYFSFQPLIQRYTQACLCFAQSAPPATDLAAVATLRAEIDSLRLRLTTADGVPLPVSSLDIQDCSDSLLEDPREVSIVISDSGVYERFFQQPNA